MKNLMQKLVKAILCLGVVSVSLIACESDSTVEKNIIELDQLDDQLLQDSIVEDTAVVDDIIEYEPVDDSIVEEEVLEEK